MTMLDKNVFAKITVHFFVQTAHNCDAVIFPVHRFDAMDVAVEIQHRRNLYKSVGACDLWVSHDILPFVKNWR